MQYAASFVGWSNTGKTLLIRRLVAEFSTRGFKVGALKKGHSGPSFEPSGKDTDLFFQSGAEQVGFFSPQGGFIRYKTPPSLEELRLQFASCDILLLEGAVLPGIPCFELLASSDQQPNTKFPAERLTAYIAMEGAAVPPARHAHRGTRPILPGAEPELIIKFLEELWNVESPSK